MATVEGSATVMAAVSVPATVGASAAATVGALVMAMAAASEAPLAAVSESLWAAAWVPGSAVVLMEEVDGEDRWLMVKMDCCEDARWMSVDGEGGWALHATRCVIDE